MLVYDHNLQQDQIGENFLYGNHTSLRVELKINELDRITHSTHTHKHTQTHTHTNTHTHTHTNVHIKPAKKVVDIMQKSREGNEMSKFVS